MKMKHLIAGAFACASLSAVAAGHSVSYSCDQGRHVTVNYKFNKMGVPVSAEASILGSKQVLQYDLQNSDNVDTVFKNKTGYRLSSNEMNSKNYRSSQIIITSPNDEILFKNCQVSSKASAQKPTAAASSSSVAYSCQQGRLNIDYKFNKVGIPVSATAQLQGKRRTLQYDLNNSDSVDTVFKGQGYRISTEAMTRDNFRSLAVMVTGPDDNILYKSCMPAK